MGSTGFLLWTIVALTLLRQPLAQQHIDESTVKAFSPNEFEARYGLMVQYKHGVSVRSCPEVLEYQGTPEKVGDQLYIAHKDMLIGETAESTPSQCTDDGFLQVRSSTELIGQSLAEFEESISNDVDTLTLFTGLQDSLNGRTYYVSVRDSERQCGQTWFGNNETFFFFDESTTTVLNIVSKVKNGQPVLLSLPLIGDVRYMVSVRTGTTCIYRVDIDVDNLKNNITRPSDSPSPSVSS